MTGCWIEFEGKGDDACASSPFLFIFPPFTTCSMPFTYAMPMNMKWNSMPRSLVAAITAALALSVAIPAADAGNRRDEQDAARRAMLDGQVMPFAMIKRRVDAAVDGASYVGSEFNPSSNRYRLKYVKDGKVVWVDADGRTGDIIGMAR
jgi:hypothetical protein